MYQKTNPHIIVLNTKKRNIAEEKYHRKNGMMETDHMDFSEFTVK